MFLRVYFSVARFCLSNFWCFCSSADEKLSGVSLTVLPFALDELPAGLTPGVFSVEPYTCFSRALSSLSCMGES